MEEMHRFTYDIGSGPQVSETFTGLNAGSFTVTVIDNSSCANTINLSITEPRIVGDSSIIDESNLSEYNRWTNYVCYFWRNFSISYSIDCGATFQTSRNF